jgi:hypothetical protein
MGAHGSASSADSGTPVSFDTLPPKWEPSPIVPRLPIGVAVVSVLIALLALVMILGGLLYLLAQLGGNFFPSALDLFPSIDLLGSAILLILGISLIAVATALWRQETWALWTTLVVVFGTTIYLFFTGSITVLFVLFVLLFVYLLSVRRYFY